MFWQRWRRQLAPRAAPAARFFPLADRLAGAVTALVALVVYVWTLAPSVTLEDAGEFITAARHFGVPHPPGYPAWTFLAWLWQLLVPVGNIAYRLNLFSAVCGALAAGLAALLVAKSGRVMLVRLGWWERLPAGERLVFVSAVTTGWLLAFSTVLWTQSVITEVYSLNALTLLAVLTLLYRWSFDPERRGRLYVAAWLWGVGLTVHQTQGLFVFALAAFVWWVDRPVGRALLLPLLAGALVLIGALLVRPDGLGRQGPFSAIVLLGAGVGAAIWLHQLWRSSSHPLRAWRPMLAVYGAVALGLALYLYLPVASATNPPLNWGYTRTWAGFVHHLTRGQYAGIHTERTLLELWGQLNMLLGDLHVEFTVGCALIGLVGWLIYRELTGQSRDWLRFLLVAFFCAGLGFLFLSNPSFEKQSRFSERVFFLPMHCVFALWIGYGLVVGLAFLRLRAPRLQWVLAVSVLALPVMLLWRHGGQASQRGHDFGYRFGYRLFQPGGDYLPMEQGAVLLAGSDPGRFVALYMIFVESQVAPDTRTRARQCPDSTAFDRRDVYLITQNALADPNYLRHIRDHYSVHRPQPDVAETLAGRPHWQNLALWQTWHNFGRHEAYPTRPLWLPDNTDRERAVQRYLEELRTRPRQPDEQVQVVGGQMRVQGLGSIMAINGLLAREIFENNKRDHTFYVEESYVIPWMYDYAVPHGLILRLRPDPQPPLDDAVLARDRAYWAALAADLLADPRYREDDVAQRTFAKLRAAIGGLYARRGLIGEAEAAFRQALRLCPDSFEASYRLAQLYSGVGRHDAALEVLEHYQQQDRYNLRVQQAIHNLRSRSGRGVD